MDDVDQFLLCCATRSTTKGYRGCNLTAYLLHTMASGGKPMSSVFYPSHKLGVISSTPERWNACSPRRKIRDKNL